MALLRQTLEHPLVHHHRRDRQIGRAERLRTSEDVRHDVQRLAAPVIASAPEAADHLVGDEEDVVFLQHRLDLGEIAGGRQDHAASPHDRLGPHGRDSVRTLGQNQLLQLLGAACGEGLLGLAFHRPVVEMRRDGVHEAGQRHIKAAMVVGQAGERGRGQGDAVIALDAADQLLLGRAAEGVVEIPHHLDGGVIGLGARIGKEHLAHRHRRPLDQHLGEVNRRVVRFGGEAVIERQLAHLVGGGLHQPLIVKAERGAPQAGDAFDIGLALLVPNPHALAMVDHHGPYRLMQLQIGIRMQHMGDVTRLGRVGANERGGGRRGHGGLFGLEGYARLEIIATPRHAGEAPRLADRAGGTPFAGF